MNKISNLSVFDLNKGDKVYDNETNETGVIVSIRETGYEVVEAFVLWPSSQGEAKLNMYKQSLYLMEVS